MAAPRKPNRKVEMRQVRDERTDSAITYEVVFSQWSVNQLRSWDDVRALNFSTLDAAQAAITDWFKGTA